MWSEVVEVERAIRVLEAMLKLQEVHLRGRKQMHPTRSDPGVEIGGYIGVSQTES